MTLALVVFAILVLVAVIVFPRRQVPKPPVAVRVANRAERHMMGADTTGDQKIPIPVRDWNALRLAAWRNKVGWEITVREAAEMLARCRHTEGCPGIEIETDPCFGSCPDREQRMSALVVLNAARMFGSIEAKKAADDRYFAPSREYFSEVLSSLAAAELELEVFRKNAAEAPKPAPNDPPTAPPSRTVSNFLPTEEEEEEEENETHPEA